METSHTRINSAFHENAYPGNIMCDSWNRLHLRAGRILSVTPFPKAVKPSYQLSIDFGPILGVRRSSAQLVLNYPDQGALVGRQIVSVTNFPTRRIAGFASQVLVLGQCDLENPSKVVLARILGKGVESGTRVRALGMESSEGEEVTDYATFEKAETASARAVVTIGGELCADVGNEVLALVQGHADLRDGMQMYVLRVGSKAHLLVAGDCLIVPDWEVEVGQPLR